MDQWFEGVKTPDTYQYVYFPLPGELLLLHHVLSAQIYKQSVPALLYQMNKRVILDYRKRKEKVQNTCGVMQGLPEMCSGQVHTLFMNYNFINS